MKTANAAYDAVGDSDRSTSRRRLVFLVVQQKTILVQ